MPVDVTGSLLCAVVEVGAERCREVQGVGYEDCNLGWTVVFGGCTMCYDLK